MTPTTTALSDLLGRVEGATGPDREIDAAIALALDGFFVQGEDPWGRPLYCYRDAEGMVSPGQGHDMLVRPYTASIDRAIALAERALPGWRWMVRRVFPEHDGGSLCVAYVEEVDGEHFMARGCSAPLAILAAILRAKLSEQAETTGFAEPMDERRPAQATGEWADVWSARDNPSPASRSQTPSDLERGEPDEGAALTTPYPYFCKRPQCVGLARCPRDPVCND